MKALVLTDYGKLELMDVDAPAVAADETLVRVRSVGICGSDVHGMDGSTGRRRPPVIMGHEAAGEIAEVGRDVTDWPIGERVTFDSTVYCGRCRHCLAGRINLCDNRRVLGVSCADYRRHGALAEYVAVPQRILYRLPDGVSFDQAATVEPLSIAFHAVSRLRIRLNDPAVVIGAGMIGLLAVQALRASGCGAILAVDLDPGRLALAAGLGADVTLRAGEADVAAAVAEATGGQGAPIVVEAVGLPETVAMAAACTGKGGQLVLVGNITPTVDLPLQAVVTGELTLLGSCASRGEYPACLDMLARGAVDVAPLISATAPLAEGASWFQRLYAGEKGLMKVILKP
jgi:L-iditol 2-dehydrogenase